MNDIVDNHMQGMSSALPPTITIPRRHMMMHMTFFWGKDAEILFHRWPGCNHIGMYLFALAVMFLLAVFTDWLSHCKLLHRHTPAAAAAQTAMYAVRIGLSYMVMLAVMSFHARVFLAANVGHAVGFFFFGSRAAAAGVDGKTAPDLPPMNC